MENAPLPETPATPPTFPTPPIYSPKPVSVINLSVPLLLLLFFCVIVAVYQTVQNRKLKSQLGSGPVTTQISPTPSSSPSPSYRPLPSATSGSQNTPTTKGGLPLPSPTPSPTPSKLTLSISAITDGVKLSWQGFGSSTSAYYLYRQPKDSSSWERFYTAPIQGNNKGGYSYSITTPNSSSFRYSISARDKNGVDGPMSPAISL